MPLFRSLRFRIGTAPVTALLVVAIAFPLHAQPTSPWSLDFGSGVMRGRTSGLLAAGTGLGLSGQVSWQSRMQTNSALLLGLNATGFMQIAGGASCLASGAGVVRVQYVSNAPLATRDCRPHFPNGGGLGLLGGMERRIGSTRAATRFSAGPMLFITGDRRGSLGLQSRVDLTFRTFSRSQFVLWSQTGLAPVLGRGNALLFSIGAGFRARDLISRIQQDRPGTSGNCCVKIPKARLPVSINGVGR